MANLASSARSWCRRTLCTSFLLVFVACPDGGADRIRAKATPQPVVAMINACKVGWWDRKEVDLTHSFMETTELGENLTETDCARPAEFAVLARQHRMLLSYTEPGAGPTAAPLWTDESGEELRSDLLEWKPPDEIDLYLYYFATSASDLPAMAESFVATANEIFDENRVGVQFVAVPSIPESRDVTLNCDAPFLHHDLGIDTTIVRLNVLFAQKVVIAGSDYAGYACGASPYDGGRFILVDYQWSERPETLAHELGHVLSHSYPGLGYYSGHVGDDYYTQEGFTKRNLMHEHSIGWERRELTVGQTYRMNVDTGSWYQHEPDIVPHASKPCGRYPDKNAPCPRLNRNPK